MLQLSSSQTTQVHGGGLIAGLLVSATAAIAMEVVGDNLIVQIKHNLPQLVWPLHNNILKSFIVGTLATVAAAY